MSDHTPPERTIVILGETGVGKSSIINNFSLNLQYSTLDKEALDAAVKAFKPLIKTRGWYNGEEFTPLKGYFESIVRSSNERNEVGKSRTIMPHIYKLVSDSFILNLVDTPGIMDADGPEKDKQHVNHITACIAKLKEIHAILVLVPASKNTLNNGLKEVLNELLSCLGKTAAKCIHFVVTHVGHSMNTRNALEAINKYIQEQGNGIDLNIFGIEADPFNYLMLLKRDVSQQTSFDDDVNNKIHRRNRRQLLEFCSKVYKCSKPYEVNESTKTLTMAKQIQSYLHILVKDSNSELSKLSKKVLQWLNDLKLNISEFEKAELLRQNHELKKKEEERKRRKESWTKFMWSLMPTAFISAACFVFPQVMAFIIPEAITCLIPEGIAFLFRVPRLLSLSLQGLRAFSVATVGSVVGAVMGAYHYCKGIRPDTEGPKLAKKEDDLQATVNDIYKKFDDEKTKFNNERKPAYNKLQSLLQLINAHLQKYAITMSDKVETIHEETIQEIEDLFKEMDAVLNKDENQKFKNEQKPENDKDKSLLQWMKSFLQKYVFKSKSPRVETIDMVALVNKDYGQSVRNDCADCNCLSTKEILNRLEDMKTYFGEPIEKILVECRKLQTFDFEKIKIPLESNDFFEEMMSNQK